MANCSWIRVSLFDEEGVEGWECEEHSISDYSYLAIQGWDMPPTDSCLGSIEYLQPEAGGA